MCCMCVRCYSFWTLSSVPLWGVFLPWCTGLVLQLWSAVCLCFGTLGKYNETVVVLLVIVCKSLTLYLTWSQLFSSRSPEEQIMTVLILLLLRCSFWEKYPSDLLQFQKISTWAQTFLIILPGSHDLSCVAHSLTACQLLTHLGLFLVLWRNFRRNIWDKVETKH